MAYNNNFPVGYQPTQFYYPQQQPYQAYSSSVPAQQTNNSIIWVQGEAGAKSYMVAPNTTVQLWDSEDQVIYLKSADASGMPSMKILDYRIREQQSSSVIPQVAPVQEYVTREEFSQLEARIKEQLDILSQPQPRARARKEKEAEDNG